MSEGSFWPKTWKEAVPLLVWCVLIFSFGFQAVEGFFPPFDIWRIGIGFGGMVGLMAMLIHWTRLKQLSDVRWLVAASMVALIVVTFSPFVEQRRWPEISVMGVIIALLVIGAALVALFGMAKFAVRRPQGAIELGRPTLTVRDAPAMHKYRHGHSQ